MSKLSKISKIPKFPKLTKIPNHSRIIIIFFFFFLLAPNVTVPVVLWAEACPFASSSTAVPVHLGTEHFMSTKNFNLFLKWGGEQMGTLGKNGAWGDATCTCPRTCVSRPCSSLCMVARVLALQVWLSTCSMVSSREESSMCRLHSWAVDDYPNTPGTV